MDLLEKFSNVEFQNDTRLCREDTEFCEAQQDTYQNVMSNIKEIHNDLILLKEKEENLYKYNSEKYYAKIVNYKPESLFKNMENTHDKFIDIVISYFRSKYDVSIECVNYKHYINFEEPKSVENYFSFRPTDEEIDQMRIDEENYKKQLAIYQNNIINLIIDYNSIIDYVFDKLGGFSFTEKVEKEIKDDCKKACYCYRDGSPEFDIKNSKISFTSLTHSGINSIWRRYEISLNSDGYKSVLRALTYFNSNYTETSIYDGWYSNFIVYDKSEDDGIYNIHETGGSTVTHFKYFKNGKFEVTFDNHVNTLKFAKEFLGYTAE